MSKQDEARRDLTMRRLEGEFRRALLANDLSQTEALSVLLAVAGRLSRDLVTVERQQTPAELPPIRQRPGGKPHSPGPIIEL